MEEMKLQRLENEQFDSDQWEEINLGREAGIDVSCYARKEFMAIQMHQIRLGLEKGLDVRKYARPEYDWFQMEEVRKGLERGVDIGTYASPAIPYDKMRQVRKGLAEGIDLSVFLHWDAKVLRQLRKAYQSKVNIVEYVKEGYESEQLEAIRLALEKGLDIQKYLVKEFRGIAITEICRGLERGLDVNAYAAIDYSWQQMREIRLGLEKRIDITLYANKLYSWQQMREIRLGLEMGLDTKKYRSLMYTAADMNRIRMSMIADLEGTELEADEATVQVGDFLITITGNEMEAYLEVTGGEEKQYAYSEVVQALHQAGVKMGIMEEEITMLSAGKRYPRPALVAKGTEPGRGTDGWYEYFFDTEVEKKIKQSGDQSVDYESIDWLQMVEAGQRVAYYHEAQEGSPGITVTGKLKKARKGTEQKVLSGKGFLLLPDQKSYVATGGGTIKLTGESMEISPVYVLENVTADNGAVDVNGCIYVKGNVGKGAKITASEDIVVDGIVEGAVIQCGGTALLKRGANGMGVGMVKAGKNIGGKFFDSVQLISGNDIFTNGSQDCEMTAERKIIVSGNNSVVSGGVLQAVKGILACHVGYGAGTQIKIGVNDVVLHQKAVIEKKIEEINKELSILGNAYLKFQRKYPAEIRNSMRDYLKIENAIYTKEMQQEKLYEKKQEIEEEIKMQEGAKAIIRGNLYEGSVIEIDKLRWAAMTISNVTVKREGERIMVEHN